MNDTRYKEIGMTIKQRFAWKNEIEEELIQRELGCDKESEIQKRVEVATTEEEFCVILQELGVTEEEIDASILSIRGL
jgi:hypothetical protein